MVEPTAVLIEHATQSTYWQYGEYHVKCRCGEMFTDVTHAQHVLDALGAAGFNIGRDTTGRRARPEHPMSRAAATD